uniref:Uncharacterized protein n=1 Tax=viral metagenome TaxID=1070528 RepID=A0A6C0EDA9_9ZZZZ
MNKKQLNEKEKIIKCLKSYLTAKKYYETDITKSIEYFQQSIRLTKNISNIENTSIMELLDQTESECSKYISLSLNLLFDLSYNIYNNTINLFEIIETGDIKIIKNLNYNELDFKVYNEEGLTPLHYAIKYGDTSFIKECLKLGACIDEINLNGHTLLEYACLEKDPNIINFLIQYGAEMKKHLLFRENNKYNIRGNKIDIILLEKFILEKYYELNNSPKKLKYLDWICDIIDVNQILDIDYNNDNNINSLKLFNLLESIDYLLNNMNEEYRNTYLLIIKEETSYEYGYKLDCPDNKLDILLYNLIPFIDYDKNIRCNWLLRLEIKYLIFTILKKKYKFVEVKNEIKKIIYDSYIKTKLLPEGLIQILTYQIIYKIKV